ncbi:MAG: 50S ribosome-binding GTPase [Candidatus Heimdallarchaeota archaeon]
MQKILLIGLDGAGKTALYQRFFQKKNPAQLQKIPPTRGIAKYDHDFLRSDFLIIDTGGGKKFRQGYIGNIELLKDACAIVYVVDVQNSLKYQETANYFSVWTKSVVNHLKGVKGYLLFNKIDPGMEAQLKNGLEHVAQLLAPLDNIFPGEIVKTITSIYTDSPNQIFQRILLDNLPHKMSKLTIERKPVTAPVTVTKVAPPVVEESFLTKPVKVDTSKLKTPPKKAVTPPVVSKPSVPPQKPPAVMPPTISSPPTEASESMVTPPSISKPMKKTDADKIREKTAVRLTDIIEATLDNNAGFVAIAVYSENVELVVGAVQQGGNPDILQSIEATLRKINLEEYMNKLGKVRIGGEGHIKIDAFDIFFEKVSPEHMSTVICSKIEDDTISNILQLNRYLNQALSITPDGVDEDTFKRADLMAELKMRLHNRGRSVDELL